MCVFGSESLCVCVCVCVCVWRESERECVHACVSERVCMHVNKVLVVRLNAAQVALLKKGRTCKKESFEEQ